jgi:uncharacterized protein YlxP (DUF503 family)
MFVGALRLRLELPEGSSLKDKRQIVKSILARLQNEFKVAAAEVGEHDQWHLAELGVACIGSDSRHLDEVMARAVNFVQRNWPELPLLDFETETEPAL